MLTRLVILAFLTISAFAQLPKPGGGTSGSSTVSAGYTSSISAQTTTTITAAIHGQGTAPFAACFDNAVPANATACQYTVSSVGDVVFTWSPAFTGYVVISAGGGTSGISGASNLTTAGAVPYVASTGVLTQAATGLFYDAANVRLGVGTGSPGVTLDVQRAGGAVFQKLTASSSGTNYVAMQLINNGGAMQIFKETSAGGTLTGGLPYANIFGGDATGGGTAVQFATANVVRATIAATTGNLLIGTTTDDGSNKLQVAGTISATSTISGGFLRAVNVAGSPPYLSLSQTGVANLTIQSRASSGNLEILNDGSNRLFEISQGGTVTVRNETPTTGSTSLVVRAGAGQSGNLTTWQDSAGSTLMYVTSSVFNSGSVGLFQTGSTAIKTGYAKSYFGSGNVSSSGADSPTFVIGADDSIFGLRANALIAFSASSTDASGTKDSGLSRSSAGVLEINNGTAGTLRDLTLRTLFSATKTPSSASDTGTTGQWAWDSSYIYIATGTNTWKRVAIATW